jgi:hypothetical protein
MGEERPVLGESVDIRRLDDPVSTLETSETQ